MCLEQMMYIFDFSHFVEAALMNYENDLPTYFVAHKSQFHQYFTYAFIANILASKIYRAKSI